MAVPEAVFQTDLVAFPGPWSFLLPRRGIILVHDGELEALASDPDQVLDLATGFAPRQQSLRQICEESQACGARTLKLAFDHFFRQYRPGQDTPRTLTPDMDRFIDLVATISHFVSAYGIRLELSLLSPLEIGAAFQQATGESGRWLQYRKGLRDPTTGAFSVQLWQHQRWTNNKGPVAVEPGRVRAFAFAEEALGGLPYRVVRPESIVELAQEPQTEVLDGLRAGDVARRVRISGQGETHLDGLNRVLVVQEYRVAELDYFSESALPFLTDLLDRYLDAGVELSGLYSDEMHIQQDWRYHGHHDHGQFTLRYVSPGLERRFAELYGPAYADFAKYLVYFCYGQEDFAADMSACEGVSHVFGPDARAIHETALFRSRYYALLQNEVVDLFVRAKNHAEQRLGYRLHTRAHASWAESPTIDFYRLQGAPHSAHACRYEYTPDFVWSITVHQAASACHDYFKWGEYLTGNGNDHPEGGWLDRNYFGLALACSTGIINEVPYSYCAHWGHPQAVSWRRQQLQNAFGAHHSGFNAFSLVQEMSHRLVEVLMLYPMDLVSADERFGSWMTQYGYANLISQQALLQHGIVEDGCIVLGGQRFTTLIAVFEPFPTEGLLDSMEQLSAQGGRVIWSGPPPILSAVGAPILPRWEALFAVRYEPSATGWGVPAPGRQIVFSGRLEGVATQTILTDFLVDHVYALEPLPSSEVVARCQGRVIGTCRDRENGGTATVLGYRPRDDQAASLGYETRNWFEVLMALGAYPSTTLDTTGNDNTEVISRSTEILACRFPNGALALAPHLSRLEEDWPGGFARNREQDEAIEQRLDLPSPRLELSSFRVHGCTVTYSGEGAVSFRMDEQGGLLAFAGHACDRITINGREWVFADTPIAQVGWGPVPAKRRVDAGAVWMVRTSEAACLRLPVTPVNQALRFWAEGDQPGMRGIPVPCRWDHDRLVLDIPSDAAERWIYGILCSL